MTRLRVIGVGSPFGADRLGWEVIERLQHDMELSGQEALELLKADRPGSALLDMMQGVDYVILIDALRGSARVGEVLWLNPGELDVDGWQYSSHGFGLAAALALGEALDTLPGHTDIVVLEPAGDVSKSEINALSASVKARIMSVLESGKEACISVKEG